MVAFDWEVFSWVFWAAWVLMFLAYELPAVYFEKRHGTLPLTRVIRDRLMRNSVFARLGVLLLLAWLVMHFLFPGAGF